jgi:ATP-dependent DNA helicase DinG
MADTVAETLRSRGVLVAEAGTGTGKTFAYLVPAVLSRLKVIVSTGTRTLQEQLFSRDLPLVREALDASLTTALLKGRSNYLCLYRLERPRRASPMLPADLRGVITRWLRSTETGDLAEIPEVPDHADVWRTLSSTADSCLGQECTYYGDCFLVRARRAAQKADVVVVNHHLLCADLTLRDRGVGELLPKADAVIVDEAHQLPEVARDFLGVGVSYGQLLDLARDSASEAIDDLAHVRTATERVVQASSALRTVLGPPAHLPWSAVAGRSAVAHHMKTLMGVLQELRDRLKPLADRSRGLESCARRSDELTRHVQLFCASAEPERTRWVEAREQGFTLRVTPLDIGKLFSDRLETYHCAWVFTSATLAVGEDFSHFTGSLGLEGPVTRRWDSPFDFVRQALLYVPEGLPEPNSPDYGEAVAEAALAALVHSRGRAFLLFTSRRAMQTMARRLHGCLSYPMLVQGQAPRAILLKRFRALGNAVLLGTASFWEGVDVRGDALSLVLIDRLPFSPPDDPVLKACLERMREQGRDPFTEYQLPEAVLALKQGAGRLIRDITDRGVIMLCDPRVVTRAYGRVFLASLPPMRLTRDLADVEAFFTPAVGGG